MLFPGKEMSKIDDLKTSEHGLTRLHCSGKNNKTSHDSDWTVHTSEPKSFQETTIFCLFKAVMESLCRLMVQGCDPTLNQIFTTFFCSICGVLRTKIQL